jgi:diadenosine tetraphosphate (Ap4A) HIT family hydrolase
MSETKECKICEFHKLEFNGLIYQDDFWILRQAELEKNCLGYLYLEPKQHIEKFSDISPEAYKTLGETTELGMNWIETNFRPKKIYLVTISEAVPHLHFHFVPRHIDSPKGLEYLKLALESRL